MADAVESGLRIAYVGNSLLNLGFKIAGVTESHVVSSTQQAEDQMQELMAKGNIGIIIITSSVRKMIRDRKLSDAISTSIMPLIVEVPELNEQIMEEDTLRQLILKAIGIDITKNV